MSHESKPLREDEYIGYTLHYESARDLGRVVTHLKEKAAAGGKFRCDVTPLSDFIFMRAHHKTTKIAVQCLLRKMRS